MLYSYGAHEKEMRKRVRLPCAFTSRYFPREMKRIKVEEVSKYIESATLWREGAKTASATLIAENSLAVVQAKQVKQGVDEGSMKGSMKGSMRSMLLTTSLHCG